MAHRAIVIRKIGMLDVMPGSHKKKKNVKSGNLKNTNEVAKSGTKNKRKKTAATTADKRCYKCGKQFNTDALLQDHLKINHGIVAKTGKKKRKRRNKQLKMKTKPRPAGWTFTCPVCLKQFVTPAGLQKHRQTMQH